MVDSYTVFEVSLVSDSREIKKKKKKTKKKNHKETLRRVVIWGINVFHKACDLREKKIFYDVIVRVYIVLRLFTSLSL